MILARTNRIETRLARLMEREGAAATSISARVHVGAVTIGPELLADDPSRTDALVRAGHRIYEVLQRQRRKPQEWSRPVLRLCSGPEAPTGLYRTVLDVFDLERLELDSKPIFRVDYDDRDQCAIGDFPLRGLQVREGRLTFLPDRR